MSRPLTPAQRQRLRTPANLWRSLIPLLAIVGALVVLVWPRAPHSDGVHVVDTAGPIAAARQQAGFTVLVPQGLPASWRPTSTEFVPAGPSSKATFRIGYVSPRGQYAEFVEGNDAPDAVAAQYGPLTQNGQLSIAGKPWLVEARQDGRQVLRRTIGQVTVIVTGSASQDELSTLAGSLSG